MHPIVMELVEELSKIDNVTPGNLITWYQIDVEIPRGSSRQFMTRLKNIFEAYNQRLGGRIHIYANYINAPNRAEPPFGGYAMTTPQPETSLILEAPVRLVRHRHRLYQIRRRPLPKRELILGVGNQLG